MPCPAWRGYGTPTTASSAPLRRMYSVAFAMSASDRKLFSERCQALVRIAHALPRLAWIRHAHYGELGAVTPDVFGCLCDERFRDTPGLFVQRIAWCAGERWIGCGVRRRDDRMARQLAQQLEGAGVIAELGGEAIARLHATLEVRRTGKRFVDPRYAVRIEEI